MTLERIEIRLGGPGMTSLHRAGLAGLYMTLEALNKDKEVKERLSNAGGSWTLLDDGVTIKLDGNPKKFFQFLAKESFKTQNGLVWFPAFGEPSRILGATAALNECILGTLLQHGLTRKADPANKPGGSFVEIIDDKEFPDSYHRITHYQHQDEIISSPSASYAVKGVLFPGGSVKHWAFKNTSLVEPVERYLSLIYAIVGVFYFIIRSIGERKSAHYALVMPEISNLRDYALVRREYARKSKRELTVSGAGEAALRVITTLSAEKPMVELKATACRVISFGKRPWNKQQKVRTEVFNVETDKLKDIRVYKRCLQLFPPMLRGADTASWYWDYPQVPELVARNVLAGHAWWKGFADYISDQSIGNHVLGTSKNALYPGERKGLAKILESSEASFSNAERIFVEACHEAWRRKLGMLGQRAKDEGASFEHLFEREFIKTRVSFSKCKNAQSLRETITAFWAQSGGSIPSLQSGWKDVLVLIDRDWRAARDLALLSLASYTGQDDSKETQNEN